MSKTRILKLSLIVLFRYAERNWKILAISIFALATLLSSILLLHIFSFRPNSISVGFVGTYQQHDLPLEVTRLLSQSLIETDVNGRVQPILVNGWDVNNDATVFKFKLKENLKWADGTAVKTSDIEIAIPNIEVSYPDDLSLEVKLKESYSPFPSLLTEPIFKKGALIGIGPYKVGVIEKSRIFITKIMLTSVKSDLPAVIVRFYPNERTALTGFALGEVEALAAISHLSGIQQNKLIGHLKKNDFSKIVAVLYNLNDAALSNRSLRQALSFSASKIEGFVEARNPYPASFWSFNSEVRNYLDNIEDAKTALERAKSSSDNLMEKEIVLTTTPQLENVGKNIIESWKKLGLKAVLKVESGIPQNFQALLITQSIPADPDQYFLWHSTQDKTNLANYSSARADKDLEDGRKLVKEEDRKAKYMDFQKTLLEDSPATFLYFPKYNIVYLKKVEAKLQTILNLMLPPLQRN